MPQSAKSGNRKTAEKVSSTQGSGRFELIEPPRTPKDVVTYREAGPGTIDPVKNAENQLEFMSEDFKVWLRDDQAELIEAWTNLKASPADPVAFKRFHRAVHVILGNAPILGCDAAGRLATPLSRLLERGPNIEDHTTTIGSAIDAISAAINGQTDIDDPRFEEVQSGLAKIVGRWIAARR